MRILVEFVGRSAIFLALGVFLVAGVGGASAAEAPGDAGADHFQRRGGYNGRYVFAMTRGLNDVDDRDLHPALKIHLMPATLILDTFFLPVATMIGVLGDDAQARQ